jgi:hypothetical protein
MNKKFKILLLLAALAGTGMFVFLKASRHKSAKKIMEWEQQVQKYADTTGRYIDLPDNSHILLPDTLALHINSIITHLDSNMFYEGRNIKEAADPQLAYKILEHAQSSAGIGSGNTVFKDKYFDDSIGVSITAEYDKSSLKLLTTWDKPVYTKEFSYNESRYAYSGKIRIKYTVMVDGETYKGTYYQQSQINSPYDLLLY